MAEHPRAEASLSDVPGLLAELNDVLDRLASADVSSCSDDELVEVARVNERAINRLMYQGNRQITAISDRGLYWSMGYRSLTNFMNVDLRVSDPSRRRDHIVATGRFCSLDGQEQQPKYPNLADAFADGDIGPAHVRKTIEVLDKVPHSVPHDQQVAAEATLADLARHHTPAEINTLGARLLAHLDPDGEITDDKDRARRRNLWNNRQGADQMSKLTGHLDPETRALLDVMLATWAKPGLNNPDDPESPSGAVEDADPDALKAAADRDGRSPAQRNHDAMKALLKAVLEDGMLGKTHRGLPVQLIIKADLSDLVREAGFGTTASGALLPMSDVIRLAAKAQPWLAVFEDATAIPLFLGRGKRFASTPQRLASFARPDGEFCSTPGCDQPATQVEMHHSRLDFAEGGKTDIVDLAPACPRHNRMVNDRVGGFTTGVHDIGPDAGRTWWRRNGEPGAPPNPARVHRLPDVGKLFDENLAKVRTDIHGPVEPESGADPPDAEIDTADTHGQLQLRQTIAPPSVLEARLAMMLVLGR
ncbi:DUF222 domain-containing protein [Gordonia sp. PKS22-38]|uniref:DUF222 domain-containing protein n=1 Tax=Gordonia prachuapensis TaxID=3115651 RepID=A0ABU7MPT1_9ACTN|nr:DUF222 domain-containing protein [Gordonia sp. PKS22-38]